MAITLVASTAAGSYGVPGPQSCVPGNTLGNLLVLAAAWDVSTTVTSGSSIIPAGAVADSSGNWWRLAGDTGTAVPGCRVAVWVCANALPVTRWLSFCPQGYVSSFAYFVSEYSGLPASYWPLIDFSVVASNASATALSPSGTAAVADFGFSVAGISSASSVITGPGVGWTQSGNFSEGGTNPSSVQLSAAYGTFSAGAVAATWNYAPAGQVAACTIGLTQASSLPVQINASFPRVFVEAAFGAIPGDMSSAILDSAYTDLSSYALSDAEQVGISVSRGKPYELGQPESGVITIAMNNQSGAFNPLNTSSPFYPDVKLGTPIRVSAQFSGRRYPVGYGYVERWPQDWPSMPQWGWSALVATDGAGVASSVDLPSAVQGEISFDSPYLCLPFSEQFSASQNTINGPVKTANETNGLSALNTAPVNQQTGTYVDGHSTLTVPAPVPVATGQSLGFLGDGHSRLH